MKATSTVEQAVPALRAPGPWWQFGPRAGKYWAIFRMSVANHFAYLGEALVRSIFLVLIIFVFVQLWTVTYSVLGQNRIGAYSLPQMIWYFAFAEAIMVSVPLLRRKVDEDVKSGDIAYRLAKPYNYLGYLAADYFGEWTARFALNLVVASGVALLLVGPITFTAAGLTSALVLLVGAVLLDFFLSAALSMLAFWIEDTAPFYLIYRRFVMLLGGMMIPLDVFPEPLSSIARALPFSYIIYGPARQWAAPDPDFMWEVLPRLAVALVVAALAAILLFRAGQRNVTVNGG
jgi:ABC-2 type transport system permease protein